MWAAALGLGCAGALVLAVWLTPDPRGVGTHTQLGLPPCGSMLIWGIPCPTCGMTTAYAHAVRGHWWAAVRTQPAGWLAALATAAIGGVSFVTVVTGRHWRVNWYRVPPGRVAATVIAVVLLAWLYRIAVTCWTAG